MRFCLSKYYVSEIYADGNWTILADTYVDICFKSCNDSGGRLDESKMAKKDGLW